MTIISTLASTANSYSNFLANTLTSRLGLTALGFHIFSGISFKNIFNLNNIIPNSILAGLSFLAAHFLTSPATNLKEFWKSGNSSWNIILNNTTFNAAILIGTLPILGGVAGHLSSKLIANTYEYSQKDIIRKDGEPKFNKYKCIKKYENLGKNLGWVASLALAGAVAINNYRSK